MNRKIRAVLMGVFLAVISTGVTILLYSLCVFGNYKGPILIVPICLFVLVFLSLMWMMYVPEVTHYRVMQKVVYGQNGVTLGCTDNYYQFIFFLTMTIAGLALSWREYVDGGWRFTTCILATIVSFILATSLVFQLVMKGGFNKSLHYSTNGTTIKEGNSIWELSELVHINEDRYGWNPHISITAIWCRTVNGNPERKSFSIFVARMNYPRVSLDDFWTVFKKQKSFAKYKRF